MTSHHSQRRAFAHDVRNALTSVYGHAQMLELSLAEKGLEKELQIAKSISESVHVLEALIARYESA